MRLYLLDANGMAAHEHYSVSDSSVHSNAEEGIRKWWSEFSERHKPSHTVACFDCSRDSNWRKILYPEYKLSRDTKPKDESYLEAIRAMPKVFASMGVPVLRIDSYEADDLMATLAEAWPDEVIIVSHDKDMLALVDDRVRVYDPVPNKTGKCVLYDERQVLEKMHVSPHRVREMLAIMGDSADNIPGVKGLGKVFAASAINQTRSRMELERLCADGKLTDLTSRSQKIFSENVESFRLCYELVSLKSDAPIPDGFSLEISPNDT